MEKPIKLIDEKTKSYFVEAGLETPEVGFAHKVLDQIITKEVMVTNYRPLISGRGWLVVALVVLGSALLLYFFPMNTWDRFDFSRARTLSFESSKFEFWQPSKTLFYGIIFVGLFLLQIPFLKRLHDKNMS